MKSRRQDKPRQGNLFQNDHEGAESDDIFRLLAESSFAGVYLIQDNLFRYVNRAFAEVFGREVGEIVNRLGPLDLAAPEDRDLVAENIRRRETGKAHELRYSFQGVRKDGRRLRIEVLGSAVTYRNRPAIIGTLIDNTEKVTTAERYQRFFDEDIAAHYITTPGGTVMDCNNAFARLLGASSKGEILALNAASFFSVPEGRDRFIRVIREKGRIEGHKAEYLKRDGKKVYVVENAVGEFDSAGNLVSIRGYLIDETNERELEGQLYQSQRLENLGTLVGGIAHDFNNILNVIVAHAGLMEMRRSDPQKFSQSLEAVTKAARRGANIVKQLLTFARKVEIVTESVRIGDTIQEVVALLRETFPEKIEFSLQVEAELPSIHADANQLHQVLLNLCVNARDAMPGGGGTITITASKVNRGTLNGSFREVEAEEYILVRVSDTGTGMDRQTMNQAFEPFFTTKRQGQGTGLGLSVVYGIMKAHHGFIEVKSEVGQGTMFSLYFPVPPMTIEAPPAAAEKIEGIKGRGETVLVVEDEEPLREVVGVWLAENCYKVLTAADGQAAVEVYGEHGVEINLVLLDMGLPKMTGAEVLAELRKQNHEVKVIAASGYLEPEIKAGIFRAGAVGFLSKPYQLVELLGKIGMALRPEEDRASS